MTSVLSKGLLEGPCSRFQLCIFNTCGFFIATPVTSVFLIPSTTGDSMLCSSHH